MPSFSLVGALEFRHVVASLQNQAVAPALSIFETPVTPYAGGHYHSHSNRIRTPRTSLTEREIDPWDAALPGVQLDERSPNHILSLSAPSDEPGDLLTGGDIRSSRAAIPGDQTPVPSIFRTPASPTVSNMDTESTSYTPPTYWQRFTYVVGRVYHTLFPTLHHFREQGPLGQTAALLAAPAVMLLTITLPVVVTPYDLSQNSPEKLQSRDSRLVDFEEEGIERMMRAEEEVQQDMHEMSFNKWLMAAQCICGPVFCATVLSSSCVFDPRL